MTSLVLYILVGSYGPQEGNLPGVLCSAVQLHLPIDAVGHGPEGGNPLILPLIIQLRLSSALCQVSAHAASLYCRLCFFSGFYDAFIRALGPLVLLSTLLPSACP
jgi:hypothetical protein